MMASLRVGPHSAGADPGPACYGRGGGRPTVTDANCHLGRIDAGHFLGGTMTLHPKVAARALEKDVAEPLGMDPIRQRTVCCVWPSVIWLPQFA